MGLCCGAGAADAKLDIRDELKLARKRRTMTIEQIEEIANKMTDDTFKRYDKNHDDVLSRDEAKSIC